MPEDTPLVSVRVLLAEDNAIQALELKLLLEYAGAEVFGPAKTVADVLALIKNGKYTCAILDVILGRQYVFPAARLLRERGTPIIFYTGSFAESIRRDWPNAQVVMKPAPPHLLLDAIRAACAVN
jgi:DNA-binding response OmpR family regulator